MLGKSCWVCGFMVYGLLIYSYPAARWQKHPHLKSPFPPKKSFSFSTYASRSEGQRASTQYENTIIISWLWKLKVKTTQPSHSSLENHSWKDDSRTSILNLQTTSIYGIKPRAESIHTLTCTHACAHSHTSQSVRWFYDTSELCDLERGTAPLCAPFQPSAGCEN